MNKKQYERNKKYILENQFSCVSVDMLGDGSLTLKDFLKELQEKTQNIENPTVDINYDTDYSGATYDICLRITGQIKKKKEDVQKELDNLEEIYKNSKEEEKVRKKQRELEDRQAYERLKKKFESTTQAKED